MYVFDDNDPQAREGTFRYKIEGRNHNSRLNYVDFWLEQKSTATASDDGTVSIQNHQNQKAEGMLVPFNDSDKPLPEVKICKFLKTHNCLVSADMDGYLNFYAVVPSPFKNNNVLLRKRFHNEQEQVRARNPHANDSDDDENQSSQPQFIREENRESVFFPIRGMDFNPETKILYTGDEAGYLQKWDLTVLLDKLQRNEEIFKTRQEQERHGGIPDATTNKGGASQAAGAQSTTFSLTGVAVGESLEEIKYEDEDVREMRPWKAHDDAINCVTYIPELKLIATCAFDQHVYVWNAELEEPERVGSLLLGNKVLPPGAAMDSDMRRYKA